MSDAERRAQAAADFAKIMADFLALPASQHKGSFTVHCSSHTVRSVDWNLKDDASRWGERREAS